MAATDGIRTPLTESDRLTWADCYRRGLRQADERLIEAALDAALSDERLTAMLAQIDRNVGRFLGIELDGNTILRARHPRRSRRLPNRGSGQVSGEIWDPVA